MCVAVGVVGVVAGKQDGGVEMLAQGDYLAGGASISSEAAPIRNRVHYPPARVKSVT